MELTYGHLGFVLASDLNCMKGLIMELCKNSKLSHGALKLQIEKIHLFSAFFNLKCY